MSIHSHIISHKWELVNPQMGFYLCDPTAMNKKQTAKELAAANLAALMEGSDSLGVLEKVAAKAGLGHGTVDRMRKAESAANLDTLDAVAHAFKIQAWQLIHPNLGIVNTIQNEVEAQLLADFRAANDTLKAAIISTSKISLPNKEPQQPPSQGTFLQIQKK
ncbi:MAG: hypothetical protein ACXU8A_00125 [Burkholderiaceae bacterium]